MEWVALPSVQHNRTPIRANINQAITQLVRTSINLVKARTILVLHSIKINTIRTMDSLALHSLIKIHMEVELVTIPNPHRALCINLCPLHTQIRTLPLKMPRIPFTISHRPHLTNRTVRRTTETRRPPVPTLPLSLSLTPIHTKEMVVSQAFPPLCHRPRRDMHLSHMGRPSIKTACHPTYKHHP